ncbi:MAG TPA: hypothetical protein VM582_08200 [Candidatus Thermoplasmatota archaeon]|nr:hypothetical protein [Candidatus Thermoplasmatota archaeon]
MSAVLHQAIKEAIRDATGYREKGILVSQVLEATSDVAGRGTDLYDAVHALFTAMPSRLVRSSMFLVSTQDVKDGVELSWDAREEPRAGFVAGQGLFAAYEQDEPIALALRELERVCQMRAGYVRAAYEEVSNSSSFPRPPFVHRRVIAHLPLAPGVAEARARQAEMESAASRLVSVTSVPKKEREPAWRGFPMPRVPVARVRRR